LKLHTPRAAEVYVLGVRRARHRQASALRSCRRRRSTSGRGASSTSKSRRSVRRTPTRATRGRVRSTKRVASCRWRSSTASGRIIRAPARQAPLTCR
jgi:hypothetical protein